MTDEDYRQAPDRRERRRGRSRVTGKRVIVAVAVAAAFAVGVALGQALHDNPRPGGQQTSLRTVPPLSATTRP